MSVLNSVIVGQHSQECSYKKQLVEFYKRPFKNESKLSQHELSKKDLNFARTSISEIPDVSQTSFGHPKLN